MSDSFLPNLVQAVPASSNQPSVSNQLRLREPDIAQRLATLRVRVNDLLLDHLASAVLHDPTIPVVAGRQPFPELKAIVVALHMLSRDSWNAEDFKVFDRCWREVTLSDLFGDEFESDRFRIQQCVELSRKQLADQDRAFW